MRTDKMFRRVCACAVSSEPILFAHVSGRPRRNSSQTTRLVLIIQTLYKFRRDHDFDLDHQNALVNKTNNLAYGFAKGPGIHIERDSITKTSLFKYSRLSLSRIPRASLKYFEISVPRHIRFAEFRKK